MLSAFIFSLANFSAQACMPQAKKTSSARTSQSDPEASCLLVEYESRGTDRTAAIMPAQPRRLVRSPSSSHDMRIVTTGESEMSGK